MFLAHSDVTLLLVDTIICLIFYLFLFFVLFFIYIYRKQALLFYLHSDGNRSYWLA